MKNLYLWTIIITVVIILILMFQNIIMRQIAFVFFSVAPAAAMGLITAICGFFAGIAAVLYYYALQSDGKRDEEDTTM